MKKRKFFVLFLVMVLVISLYESYFDIKFKNIFVQLGLFLLIAVQGSLITLYIIRNEEKLPFE